MEGLFEKIIVVDPGKSDVKVAIFSIDFTLLDIYSFPSLCDEAYTFRTVDEVSAKNQQFRVEFNGKKYVVGQGASNMSVDAQKINTHHQMCIYSAISSVVTKSNEPVCVIVGCPATDYDNESALEEYKKLIFGKSDGYIRLFVNDEEKSFTMTSFSIYPEGLSILFKSNPKFKDQPLNIVDIGGQNVNYRYYDKAGNSKGKNFSLDASGINLLEEYLEIEIRKNIPIGSIDASLIDIKKAIKNGYIEELPEINGFSSTSDFMQETVRNFLHSEVFNTIIRRSRVSITSPGHLVLFTGGGSILLKKYLINYLENNKGYIHFLDIAKWDNCFSYISKYIIDMYKNEKDLNKKKTGMGYAIKVSKQANLNTINEIQENRE